MSAPQGSRIALLACGSAAFCVSTMFSSMKPLLITRFAEQAGYSPSLAGFAAALPFLGGVCASFAMPFLFRHVRARTALTGFALGLALVELANAVVFGLPTLILLGQFAVGLCGGMLMGIVSQAIAISDNAEKTFGIVDMVGVLAMSIMIAGFGMAVEADGLRGAFLAAAALCGLFAAITFAFRNALPEPRGPAESEPATPLRVGWRGVAIIAMGVLFVTFSGLGFAFMLTAARVLGFGYEDASSAIGVILFLSAGGCLAGGWCAARFGPQRPLLFAFALCAIGWHLALHTTSQAMFLLALGPAIFALQFCFPILLSLPGSLDAEGRLAAVAAPLIVSGFAWAAIVAGIVVDYWGIQALSLATAGGMALCALILLASNGGREPSTEVALG